MAILYFRISKPVDKKVADFSTTFNPSKCQFGVKEPELYDYKFTKEKLKPSPDSLSSLGE